MKMTKKERDILGQMFSITENDDCYELEQWTNGGVDMIITLHKRDDRFNSITEQFAYYVESFDVDEEIDIYREDKRYREAFSIRESVKDFESWENQITIIKNRLEAKYYMKFSVNKRDMYVSTETDNEMVLATYYYIFGNVPKRFGRKLEKIIREDGVISILEGSFRYNYSVVARLDSTTYLLKLI